MSKISQQCDEELIATFKNEIDGDYLMRVTNKVMENDKFKILIENGCFPISYELVSEQYAYKIVVIYSVAMIFYYDTLVLDNDEEKIKARYNDKNYENELIDKVIDQLVFLRLIKPTEIGAKATYYPIMYAMFALVNYMYYDQLLVYIDEHPDYQSKRVDDFRAASFKQMFLTVQSSLQQIIVGDYLGVRSSIRILIEDYFIYRVLHNHKFGIKEYIRFTDAQKEYDTKGKFSPEFLATVPSGFDPVKYVNYGWLRIFDRNRKSNHLYTFRDLVNHCSGMPDCEKKEWVRVYNNFSKHSHGEVLDPLGPEIETLETASYIEELLFQLSKLYENDFEIKAMWNGIDLIDNLIRRDNELHDILNNSRRFMPEK